MKRTLLIVSVVFFLFSVMSCELPETFKVIYHSNGCTAGFPPTDKREYKSGEYATVLGPFSMVKAGYDFDGWNTKEDYSGEHYNRDEKIQIKNINIFLFPVWK